MVLTSLSRFQAFSIHLAISFIIFLIVAFFITQLWYPDILFDLADGMKAILLIAGVDLILGPLLTLFVFNPQKKEVKELRIDLAVVAAIQAIALAGGIWSVYVKHPVALTFDGFRFLPILANDINADVYRQKAAEEGDVLFYAQGAIHKDKVPAEFIAAYTPENAASTAFLLSLSQNKVSRGDKEYFVVNSGLEGKYLEVDATTGELVAILDQETLLKKYKKNESK